jgi:hypothetical protein
MALLSAGLDLIEERLDELVALGLERSVLGGHQGNGQIAGQDDLRGIEGLLLVGEGEILDGRAEGPVLGDRPMVLAVEFGEEVEGEVAGYVPPGFIAFSTKRLRYTIVYTGG